MDRPTSTEATGRTAPSVPGGGLRLLVVEDDCLVGMGLEYLLRSLGHEACGVAVLADQAVALAAETRPDPVLMDVRLGPGRDGVDAAIGIRAALGIPSLMTTADEDPATRSRAAPARPVGWPRKPYARARTGSLAPSQPAPVASDRHFARPSLPRTGPRPWGGPSWAKAPSPCRSAGSRPEAARGPSGG